jgi:hypothetical protein
MRKIKKACGYALAILLFMTLYIAIGIASESWWMPAAVIGIAVFFAGLICLSIHLIMG